MVSTRRPYERGVVYASTRRQDAHPRSTSDIRPLGRAHALGVRVSQRRGYTRDHGRRPLRQPCPRAHRRRWSGRGAEVLRRAVHHAAASRSRDHPGLADRRQRQGGRRVDLRVHPRYRDGLVAARRSRDGEAGRGPYGGRGPVSGRQDSERAHLLGPGLGACSGWFDRPGRVARKRWGERQEDSRPGFRAFQRPDRTPPGKRALRHGRLQ
jgi:hypothetical protein